MRAITSFSCIPPWAHEAIPETTSANVTSLHGRPFPGITQPGDKVVVLEAPCVVDVPNTGMVAIT